MARNPLPVLLVSLCAAFASVSLCEAALAEAPAASKPSSAPADTATVKKGNIVATIELDGYLDPIDSLEVRIRPDSYQGELKIKSAAGNGASVKQGDVLLEIDPTNLNKQLAEADNALTAAKAALAKAESDEYLGEQGDALALQMAQNELAVAEAGLKWFEDVDGKQMLKQAELSVRAMKNQVEDQGDELDQLKKMYKTEELTNATADIVVKRAVRSLELAKIQQGLAEARQGKTKDFDYVNARQRVLFSIEQEKQQLAQLKATQESQKVLRHTGVVTARLGLDKAQTKLNELKTDADALTAKAPSDGVVYYGQLTQGAWQNSSPKLLRAGERIAPGQVAMTLVQPARLRVVASLPESKLEWVTKGTSARVIPVAAPEAACEAKVDQIAPSAIAHETSSGYTTQFELASVDSKLSPGMRVSIRIDAGEVKDVLIVPMSVVSKGRVKVRPTEGKDEWRDVVIGKSDGENVEIRQGLKEGELVVNKSEK